MRSFAALSIAGLIVSAAAAPMNDKHDDKYDVSKYDDNKHEVPQPEVPKVEVPKHDDKYDDKKYHDDKKEPVVVLPVDDKKDDGKKDDGKKDDGKKEADDKYDDKKQYDDKKDDKKDDGKKDDGKKDDGKKEADDKYDDKKQYDDKKDDKKDDGKYEDVDYGKDYSLSAFPFDFTSTLHAIAKPDEVIGSDGKPVAGEKGAYGIYNFGVNSKEEVICFNITLVGVSGEYQSPAKTATHIHEAAKGKFGPPRIAFPDPKGDDHKRTSFGCLQGPFKTGVIDSKTGKDQGDGFKLAQLEKNPHGYYADTHTKKFPAGAVRGQVERKDNKY